MQNPPKLVHHTALAITFQVDNQQVQQLRQQYDPAFERWKPHINISFPFLDVDQFDKVCEVLTAKFQQFPSFVIHFRQLDFFPHGTVFAVPQTDGNHLQQIWEIIGKTFPFLKGEKEFHPHMTVGKFSKGVVKTKKDELQKNWKEWSVECTCIRMIERGKDTPFKTAREIVFKK